MSDERGEANVLDDSRRVVCVVSSKTAHDALVNAMIDAADDPEALCDVDQVLDA